MPRTQVSYRFEPETVEKLKELQEDYKKQFVNLSQADILQKLISEAHAKIQKKK